ncbi:MAG: hypothetical protein KC435_12915 [Thermomicrobiales bacterium]|nr:hypothetical protein [Thermomicrobiales bacterium]
MSNNSELAQFTEVLEFLITQADTLIEQLGNLEFDSDPYRLSLAWLRAQTIPLLKLARKGDTGIMDDPNVPPLLTTFSLIVTQSAGFLEYLSEEPASDLEPPINLADRRS